MPSVATVRILIQFACMQMKENVTLLYPVNSAIIAAVLNDMDSPQHVMSGLHCQEMNPDEGEDDSPDTIALHTCGL